MNSGSCRFGLWRVAVDYSGDVVYRVRFVRSAPEGPVPVQFTRYLSGKSESFSPLVSAAAAEESLPYADIYRTVSQIPYGETRTYGEIAAACGTHPRVVGNAMARKPTPLIVPCHRVTAADGIGGFSPDIEIKEKLLDLEQKRKKSSLL
ncbi:MAG: MGMT family protein [Methanocorpusculum sp.]|nr:MGMT family protein [Methanocorpusculum sp.]